MDILLLLLQTKDLIVQNPQAVVGVILPFFIEFLNKNINPEPSYLYIKALGRTFIFDEDFKKSLVALAVCFIVATIIERNNISLSSSGGLITAFSLIYAESQTVFKLYFKNSTFRAKMIDALYGSQSKSTELDGIG